MIIKFLHLALLTIIFFNFQIQSSNILYASSSNHNFLPITTDPSYLSDNNYLISQTNQNSSFSCQDIKNLISFTNIVHIDHGSPNKIEYNTEYFQSKALDILLQTIDPYRLYITSDHYHFLKVKYKNIYTDYIEKEDCSFVFEIVQYFTNRYDQLKQELEQKIIQDVLKNPINNLYFPLIILNNLKYSNNEKRVLWIKQVLSDSLELADLSRLYSKSSQEYLQFVVESKILGPLQNLQSSDNSSILVLLANAFLKSFDHHTFYTASHNYNRVFGNNKTSISLGLNINEYLGGLQITGIVPNSAADKQGSIKIGDYLIAIKNNFNKWIEYDGSNASKLLAAVSGQEGTEVLLKINRYKNDQVETFNVSLIRQKLSALDRNKIVYKNFNLTANDGTAHLNNYINKYLANNNSVNVGYLQLKKFYHLPEFADKGSGFDFTNAISSLKKSDIDALVIDLRGNTGGEVTQLMHISNALLKNNPSIISKSIKISYRNKTLLRTGKQISHIYSKSDEYNFINLPLVIIIDRRSASASEMLVKNLKINGRAIIVGDDRTHGKGTIQNLYQSLVSVGDVFKVTTGRFYGLDGQSPNKFGVKSDIEIPAYSRLFPTAQDYYYDTKTINDNIKAQKNLIANHGFRDRRLLSNLTNLSTKRQSNSDIINYYKRYIYQYQQSNSHTLNLNPLIYHSAYTSDDTVYEDDMSFKKDHFKLIKKISNNLLFLADPGSNPSQKELDNAWQDLKEDDHVLKEALNIARDYFILCKKPLDNKDHSQSLSNHMGCK